LISPLPAARLFHEREFPFLPPNTWIAALASLDAKAVFPTTQDSSERIFWLHPPNRAEESSREHSRPPEVAGRNAARDDAGLNGNETEFNTDFLDKTKQRGCPQFPVSTNS
jgi:hypothetical protein